MADGHTGGMIALVPSDADLGNLTVDGGDPADQLHLTLAYLGDDVTGWDDQAVRDLHQAVQARATGGPIQARVMGHAQFNPDGGPDGDKDPCAVYLVGDTDRVAPMRDDFADLLRGNADVPDQHEPYIPHITAGYGLDTETLRHIGPVTFDRIRVALGNDVTDYPLDAIQEDPMPDQNMADLSANGIPIVFPVMAVEGLPTSDGRYIEPGALTHRTLPISILAQTETPVGGGGHDGAEIIGRVDTMTRVPGPSVISKVTGQPFPDGTFVWVGTGYVDPDAHGTKLAQKRYLTGNSVDLSEVEAFVEDDPDYVEEPDPQGMKIGGPSGERMRLTRGVISATTLVAIPAFADGYVQLGGETLTPDAALAASAAPTPSWRSAELGDDTCLPCAAQAGNLAGWAGALAASIAVDAAPLPPIAWFRNPELPGPTPLTIDDDGRVYGHLAAWDTCHTGFTGKCVMAPRSRTDYAHFRVGVRRVAGDDGQPVQIGVGALTVVLDAHGADGHAPGHLGAMPAAAHYDNAGCQVANVEVGEDAHGIWVAGALRATATAEQVDALLAAPLSGDWRPINGHLELVAALGVNTPGFPIPRARVASGQVVSLVAAGAIPRPTPAATPDDLLADAIATKVAAKLHLRLAPVQTDAAVDDLAARRAAALRAITEPDLAARRRAALAALGVDLASRRDAALALFDIDASAFGDLWPDDADVELAGNWVSKAGGLPKYIKRISKHLVAKGMDQSRAIATAVNAAKKMCATGDVNFPGKQQVNPGSKAEACAAVADWEAKKAKS